MWLLNGSTRLFRRIGLALVATVLVSASTTSALADDPALPPPQVHQVIDSNGVNLNNGQVSIAGPSISIGQPGQSGLTYSVKWQAWSGWQSNFISTVSYDRTNTSLYTVNFMGQSSTFTLSGGTFAANDQMGATLAISGSNYIFTTRDGTVVVFDGSHTFTYADFVTVGLPSTITYPSGEVLTLYLQVTSSVSYQLLSVTSSLGYQIKILYGSNGTYQAVAINNAVDYCGPTASSCTFSQAWPTLTFTFSQTSGGGSITYNFYVTDSVGNTTTGTMIGYGTTSSFQITYPSGRALSYYDSDGDTYIDQVSDGGPSAWEYQYAIDIDGINLDTTITDPLGHVRLVKTDLASSVMHSDQLDPSGLNLVTTFAYDSHDRVTDVAYKKGNVTHFNYDGRGNITSEVQISSTPGTPSNIVTSASYPASCSNPLTCNKPTSITDANTNTTDYTYDSTHGGILTETGPAVGGVRPQTSYTYGAQYAWYKTSATTGPLWGTPAWNSFNWTGAYTPSALPIYMLTQVSKCMSGSSCSGTSQEALVSNTYVSGNSYTSTNALLASVTKAAGDGSLSATTSMAYDTVGNVTSSDGPLAGANDTTVFFYDADRNQIGIVRPDPDGSGSLPNPATKTTYNADGQVRKAEQGTTPTQSYYDFANNFTSLAQTVNSYSSTTGAKTGVASALGSVVQSITQYSFDDARNPLCTAVRQTASLFGSLSSPFSSLPDACTQSTISKTDLVSHNDYDDANRLTATESAYGTGSPKTVLTNSYTDNSKLAWVEDANHNRSTYTYDGLDRQVQLNFPSLSMQYTSSSTDYETYTYDGNGNLTVKRLRSNDTITYSYDALNRQTQKHPSTGTDVYYGYDLVGDMLYAHYGSAGGSGVDIAWDALGRKTSETSYGRTVSSQYDLAGNRTRLTYPDGNYIQYTYDVLNRMQQVQQNGSTVMVQYTYDNLGRVFSINRNNSATTNYSYNNTSQNWSLAQNGLSQSVIFGMSYSPAGQVTQRSINNTAYTYSAPALNQTYSTNGLNQYASATSTNYSYDGRGNLTCVSTGAGCTGTVSKNYSYDLENRLTAESLSSTTIGYDPLDRMQQTTVSSTTEQYLYDGNNLIVEYDGSGNILRRYVPGPGDDRPLIWYEGSGLSTPNWLHTDQQGSIVAASNSSGTATTFQYGPYGEPSGGWGSSPSTPIFRYTGQAALATAKLYYYKARMYDPALGRFLQTDPVGYAAGLNLYAYASNDPVDFDDPYGTCDDPRAPYCTTSTGYRDRGGDYSDGGITISGGIGIPPRDDSPAYQRAWLPDPKRANGPLLRNGPKPPSHDDDDPDYNRDLNRCRALADAGNGEAANRCFGSAELRKSLRDNGTRESELPPLITWRNAAGAAAARAGQGALIIGGGVGAGYLIYRGVRMLPSLAPPLWWTIPENAVIP